MRRSYVEAAFRHWVLLLLPVLLATTLGFAFALSRPPAHVSISSIWADKPITDQSSVGTTGGDTPPSSGQQALMSNYLATRAFLLAVAANSPMPSIDPQGDPAEVEPALARLAKSITTHTPGPNVLTIRVRQPTPALAAGVTTAVVDEFLRRQREALQQRGEVKTKYARDRLDAGVERLKQTQIALAKYQRGRPPAPPTEVDLQAEDLRAAVSHAQGEYLAAQSLFNDAQAQLALAADSSTLSVIDDTTPPTPLGRKRTAAVAAAGGLLAGLALATGALVLLVARDSSVRTEADVESVLGVKVAGTIERVRPRRGRSAGRRRRHETTAMSGRRR